MKAVQQFAGGGRRKGAQCQAEASQPAMPWQVGAMHMLLLS